MTSVAKAAGRLRTHLIIGEQEKGFLAEWGVPGEGCGHCTLLNAIYTQESEIILTTVGQVILHLCMCGYVCGGEGGEGGEGRGGEVI